MPSQRKKNEFGKVVPPKYSFSESYGNFSELIEDTNSIWFVGIGNMKEYLDICEIFCPRKVRSIDKMFGRSSHTPDLLMSLELFEI